MAYVVHQVAALNAERLTAIPANADLFENAALGAATLPDYATTGRHYFDVIDLANGRASEVSMGEQVSRDGGPSGAAELVFDINPATDRARITATIAFSLPANAANAEWGFDPAGQASVANVIEAPDAWVRGNISTPVTLLYAAVTYVVPVKEFEAQDIPTMLRVLGTDADSANQARSMEHLNNIASDFAGEPNPALQYGRVRHYITDDGYYRIAWPDAVSLGVWAWHNDSLRHRLGFTGDEVAVLAASAYQLTSTHRPASVLWFSHAGPLRQTAREIGSAEMMPDGGVTAVHRALNRGRRLRAWIPGIAAGEDMVDHFLHEWLPNATRGAVVTIVQRFGDSRRARRLRDSCDGQGLGPYGLRYTADDRHGRIVCQVHSTQRDLTTEEYVDDVFDSLARVDFELTERPE